MSEALAEADKNKAEQQKAKEAERDKAAKQAKAAKKGVLEHPWTFDGLKVGLPIGTILEYEIAGTDAKGKPVKDRLHAEVAGQDDNDVKILEYKQSQKDIPAVMQPQGHPWTKLSPFFWVEKVEVKLLRRESVQVPAGSFECMVADLSGFFGNHLTVWMVIDKPGVYAKVVEHPNTKNAEQDDPTEITYTLVELRKED